MEVRIILFILLFILPAFQLFGQENSFLTPEEKQFIEEHPTIRLGYDPNWPPFEWYDEREGFVGLSSEYIKYISELTGLNIVPVKNDSWSDVVDGLQNGTIDMISALNPKHERRDILKFTSPYISLPNVYATQKGKALKGGISAYNGQRVGVVKGFLNEAYFRENFPEINLVTFCNAKEGLMALSVGEISAYVGFTAVINYFIENNGILGLEVAGHVEGLSTIEMAMGGRKDLAPLQSILEKALATLSVDKRARFNEKWVNLQGIKSTKLTQIERDWIKAHPVIRSHIKNSPPFHYWEDGAKGVAIELLERISKKYGFKVEYIHGQTMGQALDYMRKGEKLDMLPMCEKTDVRSEYMLFTENFIKDPIVIYIHNKTTDVFSLTDLNGRTVAMARGFAILNRLYEEYPEINILECASRTECFEAVNAGKADAYIGNMAIGRYLMLHNKYDNVKMAAPTRWGNQEFGFSVGKNNPVFASILSKGLADVSDEEVAAMYMKYYNVGNERKIDYLLLSMVIAIILAVILAIVFWNWQLRQRVAKSTLQLRQYNDNLEVIVEKRTAEIKERENSFQNLFNNSINGIVIIHPVTKAYIDCNEAMLKLFGFTTKEEFLAIRPGGMSPKLQPNGKPSRLMLEDALRRLLKERTVRFDYVMKNKAEDEIHCEIACSITTFNGEKVIIGSIQDITQRKQQEMMLLKYQKAMESTNEAIAINTPEGVLTFINSAFINLFGYADDNMTSLITNDLFVDKTIASEVFQTIKSGSTWSGELEMIKRDGSIFPVYLRADAIKDDSGKIIGLISLHRDITERKKQELALRHSQEQAQEIFDNAPITMMLVDKHGDIQKINKTGAKMIHKHNPYAGGMRAGDVFRCANLLEEGRLCGESIACSECIVNVVVNSTFSSKKGVYKKEGKLHVLENTQVKTLNTLVYSSLLFSDTDNSLVLISIDDITIQKQQEQEIIDARRRLELLFENMPNGFAENEVIYDTTGKPYDYRFLYVNPAYEKQTGLMDVVGKTIREINPNIQADWIERYFKVALEGKPISFDDYSSSLDKYFRVYAFSSRKGHFAVLIDDTTEQKKVENEIRLSQKRLERAKTKAEEANRAKSAFLANMSHEIRTPMNAIIGFSEILGKMVSDPAQLKQLKSIKTSGKTLLNIINDILDISKIESGKLELRSEPTSLKIISMELDTIFGLKMKDKGLTFKHLFDPNLPAYIEIDELRLRQVLINLIGNALKFTHKGYIELKVAVTNRTADTVNLNISVTDTGIGISEKDHNKVFDAFQQVEELNTRKYGGTGLGLAISSKLVKLLGGTISVSSELNKGSTFSIFLPHVKVIDYTKANPKSSFSFSPDKIKFAKASILVVDDVVENRDIIKGYLNFYENIDVLEAVNGKQAIEIAKNTKPNLILMDLRMPIMDGYQSAQIINSLEEISDIPIVALTASAFISSQNEVKRRGFAGYLRKPILSAELVNELVKHMPFSTTEDTTYAIAKKTISLTSEQTKQVKEMLEKLERIKSDYWETIAKRQTIKGVRLFAEKLVNFNDEYQVSDLILFANTLLDAIRYFDIENLKNLIPRFPDYLKEIREIQRSNNQ